MKSYFSWNDDIEILGDAINKFSGDISAVEPNGKRYGYYLEFFQEGQPGNYGVFFGDQILISSHSRDEIICFLWGLLTGRKNENAAAE